MILVDFDLLFLQATACPLDCIFVCPRLVDFGNFTELINEHCCVRAEPFQCEPLDQVDHIYLLSCDKPISSHIILIPDIYPISKVSRHLARPPTPQIAIWFHPRRITLRYTQITSQFPKVTKPGLGNTPPCKINGLAQKIFRKNSTNLTKSILTFIFISNIATPQTSIYVGADVVLFFCGDQGLAP